MVILYIIDYFIIHFSTVLKNTDFLFFSSELDQGGDCPGNCFVLW